MGQRCSCHKGPGLKMDREGFETSLKGIVEKGFSPLLIPKRKVVLTLKAKEEKTKDVFSAILSQLFSLLNTLAMWIGHSHQ